MHGQQNIKKVPLSVNYLLFYAPCGQKPYVRLRL